MHLLVKSVHQGIIVQNKMKIMALFLILATKVAATIVAATIVVTIKTTIKIIILTKKSYKNILFRQTIK